MSIKTPNFLEVKSLLKFNDEVEILANACFTLNQDYCDAVNYDYDYKYWEDLAREDQLNYIAAVVILINKLELIYPQNRIPEVLAKEQHDEWVKSKTEMGWIYGEEVDPEAKTHPDLVEWDKLSHTEKMKDLLFVTTVLAHFDRIIAIIKSK